MSHSLGNIARGFVIAHIENCTDPAETIARINIAHADGHLTDEEAAQWIAAIKEAA